MDRRPLKTRDKAWPKLLARILLKCGLTPNAVSVLSLGFAVLAGWALVTQSHHAWALVVAVAGIQFRLLCNLLDGLMAVEGGAKTKTGELFNELPDRFADGIILTAVGYAAGIPWLGWLATALAMLTAYIRALGASLGCGQDFSGPGAKPHRMFVLSVGCLAQAVVNYTEAESPVLLVALWSVVGLTAVTALRRMMNLARALHAK